jgi:hypothetical protein
MRSAILVSLVLGCGAGVAGATVQPPPLAIAPNCLAIPAEDVSSLICAAVDLGNFGALSQTLQGFSFDIEAAASPDPLAAIADPDRVPQDADVTSGKPRIRGPEPSTVALAGGGLLCIALLAWCRRISRAIRRTRRHVYTIRQMA